MVLAVAAEYIAIPYKRDQEDAVRKLLLLLRNEYDSKDPKFTKRYPSIIKAHMLLLVGSTQGSLVPATSSTTIAFAF